MKPTMLEKEINVFFKCVIHVAVVAHDTHNAGKMYQKMYLKNVFSTYKYIGTYMALVP